MAVDADLSIGPPPPPDVAAGNGGPAAIETPPDVGDVLDAPPVEETTVRALLTGLGMAAGHVVGDPDVPEHWHFTEAELRALVPPLTRVVNRRPALRRAVANGDQLAVAVTLAGYLGRNYDDGRQAAKERHEHEHHDEDLNREAGDAAGGAGGPAPGAAGWWGSGGGPGRAGAGAGAAHAGAAL